MTGVGDGLRADPANWRFGGEVARNFDSHVSKSVPLYGMGHDLVCDLSDFFVKPGSVCYEIGCSTGELTLKLANHCRSKAKARFIGLDIESDMIDVAREKARSRQGDAQGDVEFHVADALTFDFEPADLIVAYYTVQFIRPSLRQALIDKLYQSLQWGGALLLFEKVRGADARFQDIMTSLYTEFKIRQGYDANEIVSKSRSLKGILEPFSTQGNIDMLKRAGFVDINTVLKYVCFEGFLAIK